MYLGLQSDYRVGDIRAKVRLTPGAATEVRLLLLHLSVVRVESRSRWNWISKLLGIQ